ncbi:MAG: hypothetical protein AAF940_09180, partial [Pseudomonadota bacterium]
LVGEHFTGIHTAREFEASLRGRMPDPLIVLIFFSYLMGVVFVGFFAIMLTEEILEAARKIAQQSATL